MLALFLSGKNSKRDNDTTHREESERPKPLAQERMI